MITAGFRSTTSKVVLIGVLAFLVAAFIGFLTVSSRASSAPSAPAWVGDDGIADDPPSELPVMGPDGNTLRGPDGEPLMIDSGDKPDMPGDVLDVYPDDRIAPIEPAAPNLDSSH